MILAVLQRCIERRWWAVRTLQDLRHAFHRSFVGCIEMHPTATAALLHRLSQLLALLVIVEGLLGLLAVLLARGRDRFLLQ